MHKQPFSDAHAVDPLQSDAPLIVYVDYKSPYAFLALAPTYQLEDDFGIRIDWRHLTLDIGSYLGTAKADEHGKVLESKRSEEQWAWVRYAYRDAKRTARQRGLVLKGTMKIWDSSLAAIGMQWAKNVGGDCLRRYSLAVYERFWRRELDIEDPAVIQALLAEAGAPTGGFQGYLAGPGRREHDALQAELLPAGLFGVPTYVIEDQVFFGREHLPMVRWLLGGRQGPAPDVAYQAF